MRIPSTETGYHLQVQEHDDDAGPQNEDLRASSLDNNHIHLDCRFRGGVDNNSIVHSRAGGEWELHYHPGNPPIRR